MVAAQVVHAFGEQAVQVRPGAAGVGRQGLGADFADLGLERGHPRAEEEELGPEVAPERRVAVRVLPAGQALVHLPSWNSS